MSDEKNVEKNENIKVSIEIEGQVHVLEVKPMNKWRSSAIHALRNGDIELWAATSLTDESYDTWLELDPTMDDTEAFFTEWSKLTDLDTKVSRKQSRR